MAIHVLGRASANWAATPCSAGALRSCAAFRRWWPVPCTTTWPGADADGLLSAARWGKLHSAKEASVFSQATAWLISSTSPQALVAGVTARPASA